MVTPTPLALLGCPAGELAYQQAPSPSALGSVNTPGELAYQQASSPSVFETRVNTPEEISYGPGASPTSSPRPAPVGMMVYQQPVKDIDLSIFFEPTVSDSTVSGGMAWIKAHVNVLRIAFKGLAWLFDGSVFTGFPAPYVPLIWTVVVSKEGLVMAGGLKEDWSVLGDVNVFGMVMETVENFSGKDMMALVSCEKGQDVYLIDDKGNVVKKVLPSETVLLRNGWILASKYKFKAYVVKL